MSNHIPLNTESVINSQGAEFRIGDLVHFRKIRFFEFYAHPEKGWMRRAVAWNGSEEGIPPPPDSTWDDVESLEQTDEWKDGKRIFTRKNNGTKEV